MDFVVIGILLVRFGFLTVELFAVRVFLVWYSWCRFVQGLPPFLTFGTITFSFDTCPCIHVRVDNFHRLKQLIR